MAETAPAPAPARLDELMMAMDVVDTLRHEEGLVEKELGLEGRDAALKQRLRELYEAQGLTVTDRILDEGIRALKESRFVYTPTPPSFGRTLAGLWVKRGSYGRIAGILLVGAVLGIGWVLYSSWSDRAAREAQRVELTETIPAELQRAVAAAEAVAVVPEAETAIDRLEAETNAALVELDAAKARETIAGLAALQARLEQVYDIRIVSRPGEDTGVFRIPDVNESARNYYIVVEAVTPDGEVLSLPIRSEENGAVETVSIWGVRVPQATYEAVGADKTEDGIVDDNRLGEKPRGALEPTWLMPVEDGAITEW